MKIRDVKIRDVKIRDVKIRVAKPALGHHRRSYQVRLLLCWLLSETAYHRQAFPQNVTEIGLFVMLASCSIESKLRV